MRPSVGRQVHYVSRGSADGVFPKACRAATVTEVGPESLASGVVGLCVINPTGLFFHSIKDGGVGYDSKGGPGTWHWPDRVEG